jgi:hypothetical protein
VRYIVFQFHESFFNCSSFRRSPSAISPALSANKHQQTSRRRERGDEDCWLADLLFLKSSGPPLLLPDLSLRALQLQIQNRELWSSGGEFRSEREDLSFLWGKEREKRSEAKTRQKERFSWPSLGPQRRTGRLPMLFLALSAQQSRSLSVSAVVIDHRRQAKMKRVRWSEGRVGEGGVLGSTHLSLEVPLQDLSTFVLLSLSCNVQSCLPFLRNKWERRE